MNIQKLEVFLSLCETLNYTETAERLYMTQGSVSKQIMALEKELGVRLFDRRHRQISLLPAGEVVQASAQRMLVDYHQMLEQLDKLSDKKEHELILHGIPTMSAYQITADVADFQKEHSDIRLLVEEEETDKLLSSLSQGNCDLIFTRTFDEKLPKDLDSLTLETDRFVAVLSQQHPLAQQQQLRLSDLKDEVFYQLGDRTHLLKKFLDMCRAAQFEPKISYHGNRTSLIIDFVEKEMGVSIMMEKTLHNFKQKKIALVPLEYDLVSDMKLVKKKENGSKALQLFWQKMAEKYSK